MIKTRFLLLNFTFLLASVYGQVESPFFKYHLYGKQASTNISLQYGSTALNNKINNKFLLGGTIDNKLKLANQKRLRPTNILGGFANADISTIFGDDSAKFHYLVSVSLQDFYNVKFTKDAYNLLMFGNNTLKGQSVDLSETNYQHLSFQNFTFGLIFNKIKTTNVKIGLGASLQTSSPNLSLLRTLHCSLPKMRQK
jgi:hypothetical protein